MEKKINLQSNLRAGPLIKDFALDRDHEKQ